MPWDSITERFLAAAIGGFITYAWTTITLGNRVTRLEVQFETWLKAQPKVEP